MPRKIPKSRKQKKLKPVDPFNFKAQQETKLKKQINLPPKDYEQEIPRSFKELFMQPKANIEVARKRKKNEHDTEDKFVKRKWESERQFLNRVNRETAEFVHEELHKIKYDLTGVVVEDLEKNSGDKLSRKEKKALSERKKSKPNETATSSASQVKRNKRKRRKTNIDLLNLKDFVEFGERVDEPPKLTIAPKKRKFTDTSFAKDGAKDLLLKNILTPQEDSVLSPLPNKSTYINDGTIKCADDAKEKMLIQERNRVIEAYRNTKLKKPIKL